MQDFRDLHVWQEAHALALNVHRTAQGIRGATYISLRSQMIRAATSIAANIVEGRAQFSDREFARFLRIAAASAAELDYHIIFASDIGVIEKTEGDKVKSDLQIVRKMLHKLIGSLVQHSAGSWKAIGSGRCFTLPVHRRPSLSPLG